MRNLLNINVGGQILLRRRALMMANNVPEWMRPALQMCPFLERYKSSLMYVHDNIDSYIGDIFNGRNRTISSIGNYRVNTGIVPTRNTYFFVRMRYENVDSNAGHVIFGSRAIGGFRYVISSFINVAGGGGYIGINQSVNKPAYLVERQFANLQYEEHKYYKDGEQKQEFDNVDYGSYNFPIYLFGLNPEGGTDYATEHDYLSIIYLYGDAEFCVIPVMYNGVAGLWNLVTNELFATSESLQISYPQ